MKFAKLPTCQSSMWSAGTFLFGYGCNKCLYLPRKSLFLSLLLTSDRKSSRWVKLLPNEPVNACLNFYEWNLSRFDVQMHSQTDTPQTNRQTFCKIAKLPKHLEKPLMFTCACATLEMWHTSFWKASNITFNLFDVNKWSKLSLIYYILSKSHYGFTCGKFSLFQRLVSDPLGNNYKLTKNSNSSYKSVLIL